MLGISSIEPVKHLVYKVLDSVVPCSKMHQHLLPISTRYRSLCFSDNKVDKVTHGYDGEHPVTFFLFYGHGSVCCGARILHSVDCAGQPV